MDNERKRTGTLVNFDLLPGLELTAQGNPVLPIEDAQVETLVTTGLTVAASVAAWWKNNSFTLPARIGDQQMIAARKQ